MSDSVSDQRQQSKTQPATVGPVIGDQVRWISSDHFGHPEEKGPGVVRSVICPSATHSMTRYTVEFSSGSHILVGDQLRFARRLSDWCDISKTQFLSGGITGPWHWAPARENISDRGRKISVSDKAA